jgi:DNA-binding SARP family transcriptional activator
MTSAPNSIVIPVSRLEERYLLDDAAPQQCGPVLVTVSVLGPVEVSIDGRRTVIPPVLSSVVALLAERKGATVSTSSMVDRLWQNGSRPPTAAKTLQGHICRVRRGLGAKRHLRILA